MAIEIIRGADNAPLAPLSGQTTAVIGFGNQGHAHALNLRDSGLDVIVGCRPGGAGARRASSFGFEPLPVAEAARRARLVILALPDEVQPEVYRESVAPRLADGAGVGFLHGFNVRYGFIDAAPGAGVVMVAPKGPGTALRALFVEGRGLPSLLAVHQDVPAGDARAVALAWAAGIGSARSGIIPTTFAEETETDLFGEQAVLVGGMTALIRAAFETLCEAGYAPELAYLECCHELKQIADLVYARGPAGMAEAISSTAEFGGYRAGERLVDDGLRRRMKDVLAEVRDGTFARALREDHERGSPWFDGQRRAAAAHAIEPAGRAVRSLMPWLEAS